MAMAITTTVTMSIMPTKSRYLVPTGIGAVLALLLLAFGGPALIARLISLPGEETRNILLREEKIDTEALISFEHGRKAIVPWFPLNSLYNDLTSSLIERAKRAATAEEQKDLLLEAEIWQRKALRASPADAYGWFRLSYLLGMQGQTAADSLTAWRLSLAAAPYERRLTIPRIQMGLKLEKILEAEDNDTLAKMIRDAWHDDPDPLSQAARDGIFISVVRTALRDMPSALADFDEKVK